MNLTPELIAIAAVGVALFGFLWRLSRDVARLERELRQDMRSLERCMRDTSERLDHDIRGTGERFNEEMRALGERVARLEGAVETNNGLLSALVAGRQPEAAD